MIGASSMPAKLTGRNPTSLWPGNSKSAGNVSVLFAGSLESPVLSLAGALQKKITCAAKLKGNMKELQDTDPMPWGKYKGTPMQDVPADYLHYLWTNFGMKFKSGEVGDYILRNKEALKQEHPDGIWN